MSDDYTYKDAYLAEKRRADELDDQLYEFNIFEETMAGERGVCPCCGHDWRAEG